MIGGSVAVYAGGALSGNNLPVTMFATFRPNGMTIAQAAQTLGYTNFNWTQMVTHDPHPPAQFGMPGVPLTVPYLDPPPLGFGNIFDPSYPFVWTDADLAAGAPCKRMTLSLCFTLNDGISFSTYDTPREPLLLPGEYLDFATNLVGVRANGQVDKLFEFTWRSTYTSAVFATSQRATYELEDSGFGVGGAEVISVNAAAVPEVSTAWLYAFGLVAVLFVNTGRSRAGGASRRKGAMNGSLPRPH